MSWKSLVCAGLLCVVASPVFAQPLLTLQGDTSGADTNVHLNAAGDWVWTVAITPRVGATPTAGLPIAAELGFRETSSRNLLGATKNATNFPDNNPGTDMFGTNTDLDWEDQEDVDPGTGTNMKPVGLQTNCAAGCTTTGSLDEIFSALGSIDFITTGAQEYLTITVERPKSVGSNLTTSLQVLGKYGTGGTNGRIAQILAGLGVNYDVFSNAGFTREARAGDTNLDGTFSIADYSPLSIAYPLGLTNNTWLNGDYTGEGQVTIADYSPFSIAYAQGAAADYSVGGPFTISAPGAASGSVVSGVIPEPSSLILLAIAGLGLVGRRFRR